MLNTTILLAALVVLGQPASNQSTTREDFKEYSQAMQGRWFNKNEMLVALWPEFGETGANVTSYTEVTIVAEGHAIAGVWYAGKGTARWMEAWDAASKQIKKFGVMSDGTTWQEVRYRKGNNWECTATLTRPNGKVESFTSTLMWTNDGNTLTYTSEVGGAPGVYQRVGR